MLSAYNCDPLTLLIMRYLFLILGMCAALSSCRNPMKRDLEEFIGSEIVMPTQVTAAYNGIDTLIAPDYANDIKMVVWYDSTGCSSCRLKDLWQWEEFAKYADSVDNLGMYVILSPSDENIHSVNLAVRTQATPFFVYKDYSREFYGENSSLPSKSALHTFLLDRNNKVVLAGSPLQNPQLEALYKSTIETLKSNGGILP